MTSKCFTGKGGAPHPVALGGGAKKGVLENLGGRTGQFHGHQIPVGRGKCTFPPPKAPTELGSVHRDMIRYKGLKKKKEIEKEKCPSIFFLILFFSYRDICWTCHAQCISNTYISYTVNEVEGGEGIC